MAWNRSSDTGHTESPRPVRGDGRIKGVVAGIVVVVGVVAFWMMFAPSADDSGKPADQASTRNRIGEVSPDTPSDRTPDPARPVGLSREERLFQKTNGYVKAAGKMLTPDGRVLTFPPPKGDEIRIVHSHGKTYRCDSRGNFVDITPKPVFDNAFEENLLGMAVDGGSFMPGMLTGHDANEISAMLIKKVEIKPDDPPEVVAKKEAVAALKREIIDYIKDGGTFDEYVKEMRNQTVREKSIKAEGIKEIVRMIDEGDAEGAAMFRDKFNEMIGNQGMRPLRLPKHITDMLDQSQPPNN